jgi:uncharacterized protein (TIGR02145 family)
MKNLLLLLVFVVLPIPGYNQTITDLDGNIYSTIIIGGQTWTAENLKTTTYSDSAAIPKTTGNPDWSNLITGAYCNYNNTADTDTINNFGRLYNWYAVETKKLCPSGWHVPADNEWNILTQYLSANGYSGSEGSALKASGGWNSDGSGTDVFDFRALPGGYRLDEGTFNDIGNYGFWWSSTEDTTDIAQLLYLSYKYSWAGRNKDDKGSGFSIRCLKDNITSVSDSWNSDDVIFYPNPAVDKLYLKNHKYINSLLLIYDLHGKNVLSKITDKDPIDISNLCKGIYFIQLFNLEKIQIAKFIKE